MKKNSFDFLWLQLKGYDRVRAIYKLRKNINKFGDKLGKKNMILNNILHKDLIGYKFMDLNITRFFPKEKINFSNDLIKSQSPNSNSEEIKNNNNEEQTLLKDQTTKIRVKNLIKSKENKRKSETLSNSSEDKIKNKYFTKIRNEKENNNNDNNGDSLKRNLFKPKNIIQNYKLFHPTKNNKTSVEFYNPKRNHSFKSDYNISPKHFNKNFDIINLIQENENIQNQKPLVNNSNINMSLYNKKIIPKIHILKLRTNKNPINSIKLQKNYSTVSINHFNNIHPKTRNSLSKKYKSKSETKMKKMKIIKHQNSNDESSRNTNRNNNPDNIGQTLNENYMNKGMNTSKTTSFNFFKRKRIPSYIRLPYINKILFPKANSIIGISGIGNNSSSVGNNELLKS